MADFPFYEPEQVLRKNLWRGSKLSQDRSAISVSGNYEATQVENGLQIVGKDDPGTGAFSLTWTPTAGLITDIEKETSYSLAVPLWNNGDLPVPVRIAAWIRDASGSTVNTSVDYGDVLMPGEMKVYQVDNMPSGPNGYDLRYSMYYGTNTDRPQPGSSFVVLDGVTLVQDKKAASPFNGDGQPDRVTRKNLANSPLAEWSPSGIDVTPLDDGWLRLTTNSTSTSYISSPSPWGSRISAPDSGGVLAFEARSPAGASPSRVLSGVFQYDSGNQEITSVRAQSDPLSPQPGGDPVVVSLPFDPDSLTTGLRLIAYVRDGSNSYTPGNVLDVRTPYVGEPGPPFDGDTEPSGNFRYRWLDDGTSEEYEVLPEGVHARWLSDGTSELFIPAGNTTPVTGVFDVGAATEARLGIVSDVYSRSREKIQLELARVDSQLIAGERVELDAAAMTASPVVWHWRQITGPTVALEPREASLDFIAPDVDEDTAVRIAVYAASEDGRNRSDWHYFDLTIKPPFARYRSSESGEFEPVSPKYVGYDRGKREIWNDVIPPSGFSPNARHETEIIDLGILPDDVQFTTDGPPEIAAAGGIYVDLETGDIYRNFGAGYNETDDTTAAPRTNAWWVNPATGDILEWIED